MNFRAKKNRRRIEVTKKTAEAQAAASTFTPLILRALGVLVTVTAAAFGVYGLFQWACQSPRFAISTLTFHGNTHASDSGSDCRLDNLLKIWDNVQFTHARNAGRWTGLRGLSTVPARAGPRTR